MESKRFPLPTERRENGCAVSVIFVFTAFFALAILNLFRGMATIASLIWVVFYGFLVGMGVRESSGVANLLRWLVCAPFGQRFVEIAMDPAGEEKLIICTRFAGLKYVEARCPLAGITKVAWSMGQASAISGKDLDDWGLFLRFKTDLRFAPEASAIVPFEGFAHLGTIGKKERAAALGRELAEWLRDAGVPMIAGPNANEYIREIR